MPIGTKLPSLTGRYLLAAGLLIGSVFATAQDDAPKPSNREAEYYEIVDVPIPDNVLLEVGGLAFNDRDQLAVSTRRGEVWIIDQPYGFTPEYRRYAHGLHEPLGLTFKDGDYYLAQRGELTRLEDRDHNGEADLYRTVAAWPLTGNYHEYSYGPVVQDDGDMLVTLNVSWTARGTSMAKWRGWLMRISPEGQLSPVATGLRSPAGITLAPDGSIFYAENQGDWVGSGRMTHLELGNFAGHREGLRWTGEPDSPLRLRLDDIPGEPGKSLYDLAHDIPALKPPAIWFPHTLLGISTSDILFDTTAGKFGPFAGQAFVGDQGHSKIMRVFLEQVNGVYQGAAFNFHEGFSSGVLRMVWGSDDSMFVGMTSRGWGSTGEEPFGLQRLRWTGRTPFEMKSISVRDDGFVVTFTQPVNAKTAADPSSYGISTFTYNYYEHYGSPVVDQAPAMIHHATVSDDKLSVHLQVHGMRLGFIHQLVAAGVRSRDDQALLHDTGYYTLNEVPGGILKHPYVSSGANTGETVSQPKRSIVQPADWAGPAQVELVLGTMSGLKYDQEEIRVPAGARVKLLFNNDDDMAHNVVLVTPFEAIDRVGSAALKLGLDGTRLNFVPELKQVFAHTGLVAPHSAETIYFEAPTEPGEYGIVCTFPGHYVIMRAKLIVE